MTPIILFFAVVGLFTISITQLPLVLHEISLLQPPGNNSAQEFLANTANIASLSAIIQNATIQHNLLHAIQIVHTATISENKRVDEARHPRDQIGSSWMHDNADGNLPQANSTNLAMIYGPQLEDKVLQRRIISKKSSNTTSILGIRIGEDLKNICDWISVKANMFKEIVFKQSRRATQSMHALLYGEQALTIGSDTTSSFEERTFEALAKANEELDLLRLILQKGQSESQSDAAAAEFFDSKAPEPKCYHREAQDDATTSTEKETSINEGSSTSLSGNPNTCTEQTTTYFDTHTDGYTYPEQNLMTRLSRYIYHHLGRERRLSVFLGISVGIFITGLLSFYYIYDLLQTVRRLQRELDFERRLQKRGTQPNSEWMFGDTGSQSRESAFEPYTSFGIDTSMESGERRSARTLDNGDLLELTGLNDANDEETEEQGEWAIVAIPRAGLERRRIFYLEYPSDLHNYDTADHHQESRRLTKRPLLLAYPDDDKPFENTIPMNDTADDQGMRWRHKESHFIPSFVAGTLESGRSEWIQHRGTSRLSRKPLLITYPVGDKFDQLKDILRPPPFLEVAKLPLIIPLPLPLPSPYSDIQENDEHKELSRPSETDETCRLGFSILQGVAIDRLLVKQHPHERLSLTSKSTGLNLFADINIKKIYGPDKPGVGFEPILTAPSDAADSSLDSKHLLNLRQKLEYRGNTFTTCSDDEEEKTEIPTGVNEQKTSLRDPRFNPWHDLSFDEYKSTPRTDEKEKVAIPPKRAEAKSESLEPAASSKEIAEEEQSLKLSKAPRSFEEVIGKTLPSYKNEFKKSVEIIVTADGRPRAIRKPVARLRKPVPQVEKVKIRIPYFRPEDEESDVTAVTTTSSSVSIPTTERNEEELSFKLTDAKGDVSVPLKSGYGGAKHQQEGVFRNLSSNIIQESILRDQSQPKYTKKPLDGGCALCMEGCDSECLCNCHCIDCGGNCRTGCDCPCHPENDFEDEEEKGDGEEESPDLTIEQEIQNTIAKLAKEQEAKINGGENLPEKIYGKENKPPPQVTSEKKERKAETEQGAKLKQVPQMNVGKASKKSKAANNKARNEQKKLNKQKTKE